MTTRRLVICAALLLPAFAGPAAENRAADEVEAIVFRANDFPTIDASTIPGKVLDEGTSGLPVSNVRTVEDLRERLAESQRDVLVLPFGSAFPVEAWTEIRGFLERGGGLVVLGGAPFHQPVSGTGGRQWQSGTRQPTFANALRIGPAEPVSVSDGAPEVRLPERSWSLPVEGGSTVWELTTRLGTRPDLPQEHGSEAYRDAVLRPLVHLLDDGGLAVACPLFEIDHLRGERAGARWIFAPSDAPLGAPLVRAIIERALEGASEVQAGPVYASVEPNETPLVRVAVRRPVLRHDEKTVDRVDVTLRDGSGREVAQQTVGLTGIPSSLHGEVSFSGVDLAPGLYRVEVVVNGAGWEPSRTTTGFWVRDDELLRAGPRVSVSRDWLRREGKPFPVIGTTYMASDVHRKFLFEPNPHVWDRDFALMARLGINFVRTGLWTGWPRTMLDPGVIDEAFLRALDAYVQTAARHDVVVNFTFFGFLPPAFGGSNPYLDPRSLEGQSEFLTLVARRYRGVGWIHWDLINEPSYAPPDGLWTNRPIRDSWERNAWREWVRLRHGDDLDRLRDLWKDPDHDVLELPWDHELHYAMIREGRSPRKARDFVLFSNEVVAGWASRLRDVLRTAGGEALVTLGQDEGGTWFRPSQQLHAAAIDYTAVHPWWQNDDLLATGVFAKVPEKPLLFQETGLMRLEDIDGWPWRDPELAAQLLERKLTYAFAARGAGFVEWAWNINPYMAIDNESVIGFLRPDGTAKPELRVVPELARFFDEAVQWLDDFEPAEVIVVVPQTRLFLNRPAATDGFRRLVRLLGERFGVVPAAISDLTLTKERIETARLVIVPSPEFLEEDTATALLGAADEGTRVLVTGPVVGDPYGEVPVALQRLGVVGRGRPVRLHEKTRWGGDGSSRWVTFDRNLQESLRRSVGPDLDDLSGSIWHEPLPLEHAREDGPLVALLDAMLAAAGVTTHPADGGVVASVLPTARSVLVVVVNETAEDATRRVMFGGRVVEVPVEAGRSRLLLFEKETGRPIVESSYGRTSSE